MVLFRERTQITRELIKRLPNLRLISQRSAYPHIDIDACNDHGVLVCSNMSSGTPSSAAAEHCWALIMAAMRDIPSQMASLQKGNWQTGVGKSLYGRQLGLYGYGRIAKQVANYARAFGMAVVWWGSEDGRARAMANGENVAASRQDFFRTKDVVSIHVRLKPETQHIITAADFAAMPGDALFVNTSRAGLIAPGALLDALNKGHPGKAAIDVFDTEPITTADDPLVVHPSSGRNATYRFCYRRWRNLKSSSAIFLTSLLPGRLESPSIWSIRRFGLKTGFSAVIGKQVLACSEKSSSREPYDEMPQRPHQNQKSMPAGLPHRDHPAQRPSTYA